VPKLICQATKHKLKGLLSQFVEQQTKNNKEIFEMQSITKK
jgi:hypothetical protein